MSRKSPKIFLDTSVIIAAIMSPNGGARLLFHLAHANAIHLFVGTGVLREAEEVLRRKAPQHIITLAQFLDMGKVEISPAPTEKQEEEASSLLEYEPDADILAQAIAANPNWLASHDKEHFLGNRLLYKLAFTIGTPGDIIAWLREQI